jgi:multidrug resistance efflux pump
MPRTPNPTFGADLTLDDIRARGIEPKDIDSEWMDEMVKRLFHELKRQLSQIEAAKPDSDQTVDAQRRATNVRALSGLERTLERLARLEQQRVVARETKVAARNEQARARLIRRINEMLAAEGAETISDGAE